MCKMKELDWIATLILKELQGGSNRARKLCLSSESFPNSNPGKWPHPLNNSFHPPFFSHCFALEIAPGIDNRSSLPSFSPQWTFGIAGKHNYYQLRVIICHSFSFGSQRLRPMLLFKVAFPTQRDKTGKMRLSLQPLLNLFSSQICTRSWLFSLPKVLMVTLIGNLSGR